MRPYIGPVRDCKAKHHKIPENRHGGDRVPALRRNTKMSGLLWETIVDAGVFSGRTDATFSNGSSA